MRWLLFSIFFLLFVSCNSSLNKTISEPLCRSDEAAALLRLKTSFTTMTSDDYLYYPYANDTSTWKEGTDCCSWSGVGCDGTTGHIISLNLSSSNLQGSIDSGSSLFLLRHLRRLDLSFIDLRGSPIVPEFGQFRNLTHLRIYRSYFSGDIPLAISHLTKLVSLKLSPVLELSRIDTPTFKSLVENATSLRELSLIRIDMSSVSVVSVMNLSSSMTSLILFDCGFNGTIPSWIFMLPSLDTLDLSENHFTGEIAEFKTTSLKTLSLAGNKLVGVVPRSIFRQLELTFLDLSDNSFTGTIELEDLSKLKRLSSLYLSSNELSLNFDNSVNYTFDLEFVSLSSCNITEFPNFLRTSLKLYYLDLSRNQIRGVVPKWLWELGKDSLSTLDLSHNLLAGPLPISLSPDLSFFRVSRNNFSGEIPSSICGMTSLHLIDLSYNNLRGDIPPCLGNFTGVLRVLDLQMNRFSGTIPLDFTKEKNSMRTLNLNGNRFEGSLPISLLNCQNLEVLDVGNNKISGPFPEWLESLPELQVLILRSNRFYGSITNPKEISPFPRLRIMDLSSNRFTGLLPSKYFEKFSAMMNAHTEELEYMGKFAGNAYYQDSIKLVIKGFGIELVKIQKMLITIDFSRNSFSGEIPGSIGRLKSLKGLNLSHNELAGEIPSAFGNLSNLEWLDLSSNELSGMIPFQLAALNQLQILNLSVNKLDGLIPRGPQFDTFNNDSFAGNSGLCGFPLSRSCYSGDTSSPEMGRDDDDSDDNNDDMFEWKVILMGYGGGLVVGTSIGYMVFFGGRFDYWPKEKLRRGRRKRKTNNARRSN